MSRVRTSLLLLLLAVAPAIAQVPRTFTFQGLLADPSGALVADGPHTIVVRLYDAASTLLYTETHAVTTARGVFSVRIGSVTPLPPAVDFSGAYTLGISVDGGAELAPRTPLASVPTALRAATADALAPGATGVVTSLNGADGAVTLVGGGGTTINRSGGTITISSAGGGGTGIAGLQSPDASIAITSPNGPVAGVSIADAGVTQEKIAAAAVTPAKLNSSTATEGNALVYRAGAVSWGTPNALLALPHVQTANVPQDLFSLTASSTFGAGYFRNTNTSPTRAALYAELNAVTPTQVAAVHGTATGGGVGVRGTSAAGNAGYFDITQAANTSSALVATTAGTGYGVLGQNTAATGSMVGVRGEVTSTSHGTGATGGATGVVGIVTPTAPGGYSAGVRGLNNGTGGTGIGVLGYQAGSGWGVFGETPSGFGVYGLTTNNSAASVGVRGETFSTSGIAVEAKYSGTGAGTALEIDNGAIKVAGVNRAAFVHTATVANKLSLNGTDITHPLCDGDPSAILIVTQKLNPTGLVYNNSPIGVYYNTVRNKWEIFNENVTAIPTNAQFNVLVIKQ